MPSLTQVFSFKKMKFISYDEVHIFFLCIHAGLILQNYYVTPLCTPSRSALMTGKHPIHTGKLIEYSLNMLIYNIKKASYLILGMQHDVIYGDQRYGNTC